MADEIRITKKRVLINGSLRRSWSSSYRQTQTTAKVVSQTQTIGQSAHEAIVLGDVSTPGRIKVENLDATNYVEIGIDVTGTFHPLVRVLPGAVEEFRLTPTAVPYAKANTAAVELDYEILAA
jgi:hypothetical protein